MAINFPDSPSNEDTFTANGKTFVYNSTNTSWRPQTAAESGGTDVLADMAALIAKTGMSNGDQALVQSNNNLYMYSGSGWYKIATIQNDAPSAITGVDGSYTLALDGTATTITAVSTDPEGFALTWSYTASGLGSIATVSQVDNVFTVTPSTDAANAGSFTLTISATDGINGAVSTIPSFTLSFIVTNSRYTALSVRATNTGSNQTFDDASTSNHTITASDATASTFSPYRAGGYSAYFDNPTVWSYLRLPDTTLDNICNDTTASAIATHVTTIEAWVYPLSRRDSFSSINGSGSCIFTKGYTWFNLGIDHDGYVQCYHMSGGSGNQSGAGYTENNIITSNTVPLNAWTHVAAVIENSQVKVYVNGVLGASGTWNGLHDYASGSSRESSIGAGVTSNNGPRRFDGYICDFRISDNARYTSNFTQSTEFLTVDSDTDFLLGNLPYFKDQSASNHAITVTGNVSLKPKSVFDNSPYSEASHGASAYFDGTGDYLDVGSSGIANFGIGDFTIEFWINSTDANALASGASNIINPISSTGSGYWGLMFQNGKLRWNNSYNVANLWEVNASTILNGSFNHIAVVRNSGAFSIYFNGVAQSAASGTFTDTTNYSGDTGVRIGSGNANDFVGTLSDLRIVSSAVYTANFTPPTAPLTAVTNTKFLLNPETSISDLSQRNAIKCVGDAATSTTQVKFAGTKSIAFDGTGDYLQTTLSDKILTSQFTVEGWVRMSTVGGPEGVFHLGASAFPSNIDGLGIFTRSSTYSYNWGFFCNGTQVNSSTAPSAGVWYHLALVRDSNNLVTMYLDGNSLVTSTQSGSIAGDILTIGGYYNSSYIWNGNIQDFRITKGLARYTSNFTPPTAELEG